MSVVLTIALTVVFVLAPAQRLDAGGLPPGGTAARAQLEINPRLLDLPRGKWIKIHQQRPGDSVTFVRQRHGGSAFDSRRGRLVLFGSDTHATGSERIDWTNSPLFFDVARLEWSRLYPDDDPGTYRVDAEGVPVAGERGDHPWAMHTSGSVVYDTERDALVVSSFPYHLKPGLFTEALAGVWPRVRRHPTWKLDLATGSWRALPGKAVHFYAYATAYDPDRGVVIGYKSAGVFELGGEPPAWRRITSEGLVGYNNNVVYDSNSKALIVFGSNEGANDVVAYEPATGRHRKMATPGSRPPKDRHVPMAFHPGIGRTVALVDRKPEAQPTSAPRSTQTETWLYDYANDAWSRVESATLPFASGMNYNLEYDPGHGLLLLVANPPGEATAVWALRL